ncbi:type IV pilus assembly protein PilY1 [Comamonas odontotermitis]|uniref:Type IV pilus assembly protein PilY1 n=1 Tax=Comamonas odontotermitis TaxID=379895 RepID=A0ABR6RM12_9BURK|nr:PilC/PilY family type IV pilus protein [Comamonas odontotermitis]MBB6580074.1 type IV pilus assembly protein PilY1 [Comamonas odontotermitis]
MMPIQKLLRNAIWSSAFAVTALAPVHTNASSVALSDVPIFSGSSVPGNLTLPLSVEFPTALSVANLGAYSSTSTYYGYFDPDKCYDYVYDSNPPPDGIASSNSYFQPAGKANAAHECSGKWSGNFMNWATMPTIDPFRWALTGGYRSTDIQGMTILQKGFASNQGSSGNFPNRGTAYGGTNSLATGSVSKVSPFPGTSLNTAIFAQGVRMLFTTNAAAPSGSGAVEYGAPTITPPSNFFVQIRVRVCDPSATAGGVESNCVKYGSDYKPEGLMQKYANKIRYSVFGYLMQGGNVRDGGVLRAKMGFIGPTYPTAGSVPASNPVAEWSASTGIMATNPDSALAAATTAAFGDSIKQSGAMNYLNKFGNFGRAYETYDNVSELYYAAIRYLQNKGNVPEWTNNATGFLDGFPVATQWTDPITQSCQKNFILGIGDVNTHFDSNTGGGTLTDSQGPAKPAAVAADTFNKSATWTSLVEAAEGGSVAGRGGRWGSSPGSEYIAGLAYGNHVKDMRPDLAGNQTVSTYWLDVMEGQYAKDRNPYWLAAKYGGFTVPAANNYDPATPVGLPSLVDSQWTDGEIINMNGTNEKRPSNYFLAGKASQMIAGLNKAFSSIAAAVNAYTTAVMPSSNVVSTSGTTSYAASYGSESWSGTIGASTLTVGASGTAQTALWSTDTTLTAQFNGTGWDTSRVVVAWDKAVNKAVPFRIGSLSSGLKSALDTTFVVGDDSSNYLNYLRGDKSNEVGATSGTHAYRSRTAPLGDIVNSKITLSAAPKMQYLDASNPGYAAYKASNATRTPLVLFGSNDGMLHVLNGSATGADAGKELFSYVPGLAFYGPDGSTTSDANTNGLAAIGNPAYEHRFYVDATPQVFDVDFQKTQGSTLTAPTWKTLVVGGLGKGGKGFYAIDITNPGDFTTEASAAGKVLWEISNTTPGFEHMGYSYGAPVMVKTAKYGWTLILTSGYNNDDGNGYLFLVNPTTGALLDTISTGTAAPGLAQASAFINAYTDGTADAVYAGDLNGQLWRFDLTAAGSSTYPAPQLLFQTASPSGGPQPITVAPIPEVHPRTLERVVLFGTGKLLDGTDIAMSQVQSFYAVTDGDGKKFNTALTSTLHRSDLVERTSLTSPVATMPTTARGWFYNLGTTDGTAWRTLLTAAAANGIAVFTSTLTSGGDGCSPSGSSRAYGVDFANGSSVLQDPNNANNVVESLALSGIATDNTVISQDGETSGLAANDRGDLVQLKFKSANGNAVKLINWREVNPVD